MKLSSLIKICLGGEIAPLAPPKKTLTVCIELFVTAKSIMKLELSRAHTPHACTSAIARVSSNSYFHDLHAYLSL